MEQTQATAFDLPVCINTLWNPMLCPVSLLPWLAWTLSIDDWNDNDAEQLKRNQIANSIALHRQKGTLAGLKNALAAQSIPASITEWFQNQGAIHTFTVDLDGAAIIQLENSGELNSDSYQRVRRIIDQVKPARSHYQLRLSALLSGDLVLSMVMRVASIVSKPATIIPAKRRFSLPSLSIGTVAKPVSIIQKAIKFK